MLLHKTLLLSLDVRWPPKNAAEAKHFLAFLITRIDMAIASSPELPANPIGYYCDAPGNEGVTAVGILETSHCVVHSWDLESPAKFRFDLYSCKDFDIPYVIALCNSFGIITGVYLELNRETLEETGRGRLGLEGVIIQPDRLAA